MYVFYAVSDGTRIGPGIYWLFGPNKRPSHWYWEMWNRLDSDTTKQPVDPWIGTWFHFLNCMWLFKSTLTSHISGGLSSDKDMIQTQFHTLLLTNLEPISVATNAWGLWNGKKKIQMLEIPQKKVEERNSNDLLLKRKVCRMLKCGL